MLLLGRLAWRLTVVYPQMQHAEAMAGAGNSVQAMSPMGYASSPLTMLVIGLLVGYYIAYYSGVLIHHRRFERAHPAATASEIE
ncbi:MAG: hypothetical protein ABI268_12420 [Rhodanobacter sp.]